MSIHGTHMTLLSTEGSRTQFYSCTEKAVTHCHQWTDHTPPYRLHVVLSRGHSLYTVIVSKPSQSGGTMYGLLHATLPGLTRWGQGEREEWGLGPSEEAGSLLVCVGCTCEGTKRRC